MVAVSSSLGLQLDHSLLTAKAWHLQCVAGPGWHSQTHTAVPVCMPSTHMQPHASAACVQHALMLPGTYMIQCRPDFMTPLSTCPSLLQVVRGSEGTTPAAGHHLGGTTMPALKEGEGGVPLVGETERSAGAGGKGSRAAAGVVSEPAGEDVVVEGGGEGGHHHGGGGKLFGKIKDLVGGRE